MAQRPHRVAAARTGVRQRLVGAAVVTAETLLLLVAAVIGLQVWYWMQR
jgi:hypothetical protein